MHVNYHIKLSFMDQPHLSTSNKSVCGGGGARWSDLPDLALHEIAVKLSSPLAFSVFARVCRSWRSIAKSAKSDFMASQPPLVLHLPAVPSDTASFHLYCLADKRSYNAKSPALASLLANSFVLGHQHGYLIAVDKGTNAPALVNLCTDETYSFPPCPCEFDQGLLTSPPNSGDCMLILYEDRSHLKLISYCRVGEPFGSWNSFHLPRSAWAAAVHEGRLYFSSLTGQVTVLEMGRHGDSLNLVRVIEPPCNLLPVRILTVFEEELVMISLSNEDDGLMNTRRVHRLGLCNGDGEDRWTEGLGVGRILFESDGESTKGRNMRGYVFSGRMKGVKDKCIYRLLACLPIMYETDQGRLKNVVGFIPDIESKRVWVHPNNLEQWGFKNLLV